MSKNDQQDPKFEDDTDLLINQLKSEIKSLQSQNSSSQDKLIEGISKVEEQLNIQSPENSRVYNLDPMDRILRVGSNIKSLHSQILNQIFDIFSRGLYDTDFLEDTLTTIQEELEGSAMLPEDNFETQETLQNLRQIALDESPEIEKLREALKQSLMIHQDSECKIKSLRARISNLEHQIIFYIESNQNPGKNPEALSLNSDDENTSELSTFNLDVRSNSLQLDSLPRTINRNRNRAASVRSKKFHKPHNSINPKNSESVDQYAFSKIQQQKLESGYKDQIFQLNSKITQYKAQIDLEKQNIIKIKVKYDKLAQNFKLLSRKFQKSQEINKQSKDKIKELEETIVKLKKPEEELQEKIKVLKDQLNNVQAKSVKDDQLLNKYKSALSTLKKKFDQLKQKSDSIENQFSIVEKSVLPNEENQNEKVEGQTQAEKIVYCFNQLKQQNSNLENSNQSQKSQIEKYNSYFLNIRQALGLQNESLNLLEQTNSEILFNKEIVDQVNQINKEVEDYKSQLKQIQTTLGMSEISSNDKEGSIINKIKNYQNENEQVKQQLSQLRKTLGLPEKGAGTGNELNEVIKQTENTTKENQQLKEQINQMKKAMGIDDTNSKDKQTGKSVVDQIINTNNEKKQLREALQQIANYLGVNTKPYESDSSPAATKQFCSDIINAVQSQIKENSEIRESLGISKTNKNPKDSIEMVKSQKEENAILKKHIQNLLSEFGLQPINDKEPSDIEKKCSIIETEIKKIKENREKLQEEMNSLKKSLGLENEKGGNGGSENLTSKVNSINAENNNLKEQIQKMTTENAKLKQQISEMCEMLGIPNITERSIEIEGGNENGTQISQNINQIKTKLTELQSERDNMKTQIINLTDKIHISNTEFKESNTKENTERSHSKINTEIINKIETLERTKTELETQTQEQQSELSTLKQTKTELETKTQEQQSELSTLKRALGIEEEPDESSSINTTNGEPRVSKNEALNKIEHTKEENTRMKTQLTKLRELLGLPQTDDQTNSDEIFSQITKLQQEKTELQEQNTQQSTEMNTLKQALGIEDENDKDDNESSSKPKSQNMIDTINAMNKENAELKEKIKKMRESLGLPPAEEEGSDDKNLFARIDEVNSENSILKKQVQEMCKMLGIPDLTEENKGEGDGKGKNIATQLEEASNEIKNKLNELQSERDNMKTQIINLTDKIHISNTEFKESNTKENTETSHSKINTEIINKIETLERTKTELETKTQEQQSELSTLKRALGIEEESDESSSINTTNGEPRVSKNEALNKIEHTKEENTRMKTQLTKLRELLGLPQTDDQTNSDELFSQITKLQQEKTKLQEQNTQQSTEMNTLKQALGIENEDDKSENGNVLQVVQNTTQENANLKEQIQKMTTENAKLKQQISEMCEMLGIPNITERSIEIEGDIESETQIGQNINQIKTKLTELQSERDNMKTQIINLTDKIHISNTEFKESNTKENTEQSLSKIIIQIKEIFDQKQILHTQQDSIRSVLGFPAITNEDLSSKSEKGNKDPLLAYIENMKSILISLSNTLGTDPNDLISDSILEKLKGLKKDNESLKEKNDKQQNEMKTIKEALGIDEENENETENVKGQNGNVLKNIQNTTQENNAMKDQLDKMREILGISQNGDKSDASSLIEKISEVNSENSILKKQVQEMCKMLGIPDLTEENKGEVEGKGKNIATQLEEASNEIKNKLNELQSERDNMKTQIINLTDKIHISNTEFKESNTKENTERSHSKINTEIINKIETLERTKTELETQTQEQQSELSTLKQTKTELETKTQEQQSELSTLKRALGIEEESDESSSINTTNGEPRVSKNEALNKIEHTKEENTRMKTQLTKLRELLGLPQTDDPSKSNEVIQTVENQNNLFKELHTLFDDKEKSKTNSEIIQKANKMKNEFNEQQKMIEKQKSTIQQKEDEFNEIESLLQDEFEQDKEDKTKHSKSKVIRAIKRIKKNNKQLENATNQSEQEKQNLIKKLADKKKKIEELKEKIIETQSKASGMMEERSSIYNKIQSLQDSIVDVIKAPDSPKSPVYQKLNGISQEISNQQSMIGELAQDKERMKRLERFEEERTQIIDNLLSNGLLNVQDRKDVNLSEKIGEILKERKEIMNQSDSSDGSIASAFKKLKESNKKLENELNNKEEQLKSIKKVLGFPNETINEDQIITKIKEINNNNENLQNEVKTIKQALGLPFNENEKQIPVDKLVTNLRNQVNELQEKIEDNKKERKLILSSLGISESIHSSAETIVSQIEKIKNENKNLNKEHTEIVRSLSNFGDGQNHEDVVQSLQKLAQERQTITRTIFSQDDSNLSKMSRNSNSTPLKETNLSLKKSKSSVLFKTSSEVIQGLERIVNDAHNGAGNRAQLQTFESKLDQICAEFGIKEKSSTSIDKKLENLHKIMKNKLKEVTELKQHLNDYKNSIKRVQKLLGVEENININNNNSDSFDKNAAAELEAQIINFITKTEEEKENKTAELENKISELKKKLDLLSSILNKLKKERSKALSILDVDENNINDTKFEFDEDESPLIEGIQKILSERKDLSDQIEKLKEHLTTAAGTIQSLNGERNSIMQALMPGGGRSLYDTQIEKTTKILFKNLESLGIQISNLNDSMNSAISGATREINESASSPIPKLKKRERPLRPQSHIVAALNTIRSQLENAQKETANKEIKIAELEDEIDKLKKK